MAPSPTAEAMRLVEFDRTSPAQKIPGTFGRGWLRLYKCMFYDRMIGFLYAFQYKKKIYCYQSGQSRDWMPYSIGTFLIDHCVRSSIDEGCTQLHFLRGKEAYKYRWAHSEQDTLTITTANMMLNGLFYAGYCYMKSVAHSSPFVNR
jgi:CelD/BcsL family acetyltransferase involved in cellulose biosynthesis